MITSTSKVRSKYEVGDYIKVRVIEFISDHAWIVSLDGSLIQIQNKSHRPFQVGQMIGVRVESLDPVILALA